MKKLTLSPKMGWVAALPQLTITFLLAIIAISTLTNAGSRQGGARENLFDLYQRLAPAQEATPTPFHLVEIDEESLRRVGPWPWPRSLVAQLVETSTREGAAGVIYVEPVDSPDSLSPETIGAFWLDGARDDRLAEELRRLPSTDARLGAALAQTQSAYAIDPGASVRMSEALTPARTDIALASWARFSLPNDAADPEAGHPGVAFPAAKQRFAVNDDIEAGAQATVTALPLDQDGVFRAATLIWNIGGEPIPSIALEAARLAVQAETDGDDASDIIVQQNPTAMTTAGRLVDAIIVGDQPSSVDRKGRVTIAWPHRIATPATSAWRLLEETASNSQLKDKIVLIGRDTETGDAIPTPRGDLSPAALHALVANQMLVGDVNRRPAWLGYAEALSVMALGAFAMFWSQRLSFWRAFGAAAAIAALALAGSAIAYYVGQLMIDPLPGVMALFLGAFSVAGGRTLGAALSDDQLRGNFKGALPEPTMKKMREEGASDILDGVKRDITILACELTLLDDDLKKFAGRPGDVTNLIASASQSLRKELVAMGGAADQADGGKIYGYFNAPLETADHTRAACSAALRLVESMDKINAQLDGGRHGHDLRLHLAIGVASGECLIGPMGHGRSNRYSAVGEPMRFADFLRRQAGYYGPAIICHETVYRKTHHNFAFLELDRLQPRDAARPFSVHALVGNPFLKSSKSFRALDAAHREMLTAFREGDFKAAQDGLEKARRSPGSGIALFDIYEQRIAKCQEDATAFEGGVAPVTI